MRADRLVAALLLLQRRDRVTAHDLARELEVSVKTARRDLDALSMAGLPVYSQPGRNGGWSLLGGGRTDLSGLTAGEARDLFLVAATSSPGSNLASALRKLLRALPEPLREDAEKAAAAVVEDPTQWGRAARAPDPNLDALRRAVIEQRQVDLRYVDGRGNESARRGHPLGLVEKAGSWYLVADTEAGLRTFRLPRIRSVTVTDEPALRPEGFDLGAAWRSQVAEVERHRRQSRALVRVRPEALPQLAGQFGADLRVLDDGGGEGMSTVEIWAQAPRYLAERLAGWGGLIEVVEPEEVRGELRRIAADLLALYPAPGGLPVAAPQSTGDAPTRNGERDGERDGQPG